MKHIKTFESEFFKHNYRVDDYVLIKEHKIYGIVSRYAKIIEDFAETEGTDGYEVEFTDGDIIYILDNFIERYLTPEEIKEYELEKSTNNYNL